MPTLREFPFNEGRLNLLALLDKADTHDEAAGASAYRRYKGVMQDFADAYGFPLTATTEAFVALSPNNDYHGNLRSLASVLQGVRDGVPVHKITVSTYGTCRYRAATYLTGRADFLTTVRGPKITAFRHNILNPDTSPYVTIDGHMVGAWVGEVMTMKQAAAILKSRQDYNLLQRGFQEVAKNLGMVPNQLQATLWFTRKRVLRVKYDAQPDLFFNSDDVWKISCKPRDYPPYPLKSTPPLGD